jgi:RND family efflux transporter MFP subunit
MVSLDPRDYVAEVQKANATLAQSSADFQRYQKLFDEGVTSQADLDARRKRYEVSKADLDRAKKAREDADLIAPFSGVVARKLVDDFQNVRRKEPVLILQDVSRLKFTTALPEADLTSRNARPSREEINARIDAHVIVSTLPDLSFEATLGELALTADPTTRTFDATFYFQPPDDVNVLPGMTAKVVVSFDAGRSGDYQVPGTAVFADDEGGSNVWRVDMERNVVERVPVSIGAMSGDRITIQGGLAAGDVIAFSGVHELEDGRLVREYVR